MTDPDPSSVNVPRSIIEQARRLFAREESPEYARPTPTEWRHIAVALVAAAEQGESDV